MRRRDLFNLAAAATSGMLTQRFASDSISALGEAAEWLAWEMWTRRVATVHESRLPPAIVKQLARTPTCIRDERGFYRLTQPGLVDVLVAQRLVRDISDGSSNLLGSAQTSHRTDLALARVAGSDPHTARPLIAWAGQGHSAILRVNAAGILAKTGSSELGDMVISTLKHDPDARQLYLSAVASRVLSLPWPAARRMADAAHAGRVITAEASPDSENPTVGRLAVEIRNPRDAGARWCSIILLATVRDQRPDAVATALRAAVARETCRENLRAMAAVLGGNDPISV